MLTEKNELSNSSLKEKIWFFVSLGLLMLMAGLFLFPFYWMLVGAFQPSTASISIPPTWFPKIFTLANFNRLFTRTFALRWFLNSVIVAGSATVLTVAFASMSGYAFAKKKFPGRQVIFWTLLATMMVPKQIMLIPLYMLMNKYYLYNTYPGMFLPKIAAPFAIFLMRQFMQSIPDELIQSAKIDGAGEGTIFTKIIIPLSLSALGTVAILTFLGTWNDYMWQLIIVKDLIMSTLPVGIAKVSRTEEEINYGLLMAGATFGAIPMLAMFLYFQKYFIRGITMGAIKG